MIKNADFTELAQERASRTTTNPGGRVGGESNFPVATLCYFKCPVFNKKFWEHKETGKLEKFRHQKKDSQYNLSLRNPNGGLTR